jgi:hypothetical protein
MIVNRAAVSWNVRLIWELAYRKAQESGVVDYQL